MTHFSQQDNFSVAARVLGALFYYAPESAEAAPLVAVLTRDGWETQWPLPEASLAPLVTAFQAQSEETRAQAWQRLFVGPWALPSPPWGSVWLDRESVLGSLFIAEVLFGTMMLASLGPVIISAVVALLVSNLINHSDALLYSVQLSVTVQARDYALIISTGVLAGLCGPLLLTLMNACHREFVSLKLAPPWQLALGGLIVGLLSLFTPAVWGNGYSTVQSFLTAPPLLMIIAGIFLCKLFAVLASSGSGAPGGVFTPTLFIGLAIGMLYGRSLGLWFPDGEEITLLLGLTGMATLLAATTHAPIMSTLMICEMTGEYQLLPGLLIACVIASVISRTLHRDSIYRQHTAKHS
ncbi:TPA: voltage-gated ClC-type chloride channel ClcB [Escherichia coli]|nr:voltage-gated ClC-type chloride channel ClcB [Escherichia coli]